MHFPSGDISSRGRRVAENFINYTVKRVKSLILNAKLENLAQKSKMTTNKHGSERVSETFHKMFVYGVNTSFLKSLLVAYGSF